jgi:hypothetical protein
MLIESDVKLRLMEVNCRYQKAVSLIDFPRERRSMLTISNLLVLFTLATLAVAGQANSDGLARSLPGVLPGTSHRSYSQIRVDTLSTSAPKIQTEGLESTTGGLETHLERLSIRPSESQTTAPLRGWDRTRGLWRASITIYGRTKHLGSFRAEIDAARAYDDAACAAFGEFSCCNFLVRKPCEIAHSLL